MTSAPGQIAESPRLFMTDEHRCAYIDSRSAQDLIVDPAFPLTNETYNIFLDHGFRRSGALVYRPCCKDCRACIAVRVPVAGFSPDRRQRRIWQRNHHLQVKTRVSVFCDEHFRLYQNYLAGRHSSSPMQQQGRDAYIGFLCGGSLTTLFYEFRDADKLVMVAVVDKLLRGLSAVYTFFDPQLHKRSLGTYAILWEIQLARQLDLAYLYLGYWIGECRKMSYKCQYRPIEAFRHNSWRVLDKKTAP